ncbi:MAG: hypothetical protein K6B65_03990 [Bacilli bacterium]|nr:hypothetical protein [Bacilli bacterium]
MTEKNLTILSSMCDSDWRMRLSNAFITFQDCAMEDAAKLGVGKEETTDKGLCWVFTRIEVKIERYPLFLEECKELTNPLDTRVFAFPRQYRIRDKEGHNLIHFSSLWALITAKDRKLVFKPTIREIHGCPLEDDMPLPTKTVSKESAFAYSRTIRHSDIDINGHLNNVRYIEAILDVYPTSFFKENEISRFLINFNKEVHEGEELKLYVSEDKTYVKGEVGGVNSFEANIEFRKR